MNEKEILIKEFEADLNAIIKEIEKEVYKPKLFKCMVSNIGGYQATKKTISKVNTSGYLKLYDKSRLDLSIENLVINKKYRALFTQEEIKLCNERLEKPSKE